MNSRQILIAQIIQRYPNGIAGADSIAYSLGYRPATNGRLSVSSSLRSMMKAGWVGRLPPRDQWDHAVYFLMPEGKEKFPKWEYWL